MKRNIIVESIIHDLFHHQIELFHQLVGMDISTPEAQLLQKELDFLTAIITKYRDAKP